jgi:photosystem II stability/assembly factor-like uncharacterized protein
VLLAGTGAAGAHDSSAYGGLFRSRDFGGIWLNADVGLFLGGAVALAINPADPNYILLGTDSSLLVSRSGGRDWKREAPDKLFGAVFAVAFLPDGNAAVCSTPAGIFRFDSGGWQRATAPPEAAPSRAIALGADPQRVYLLGRRELYRSDDAGRVWTRVEHDLADRPEFTALAVEARGGEALYAIADGRVLMSRDRGANWRARSSGLPETPIETLALDVKVPGRVWAGSADRIYRSDDGGERWAAYGQPLPEPGTNVRGIAVNDDGRILVLTTHRGVYRSTDGAQSWGLLEGNLPVHLEARPLMRDPSHAGTLYAGYALMPYGEIWRNAVEGGNLLSRIDAINLGGAAAFMVLLCLCGYFLTRWLIRRRDNSHGLARNIGK